MSDWKIFHGHGAPHDELERLPPPPPWRFARPPQPIAPADNAASRGRGRPDLYNRREETSRIGPSFPLARALPETQPESPERARAEPFEPSEEMVRAVNAALYLRRPLLLTGKPGSGKSTLISKVAHELKLGRVIRWPVNSRSTVRAGVYDYDAVGRLQAGAGEPPPVAAYLKLGPLGTALLPRPRPCALLIDEIDKSDLDFANDLLNVIEEGEYVIPELKRLPDALVSVPDVFDTLVAIPHGRLQATHFPFVVMTSNAEREFPAPFLRRCIRLDVDTPRREQVEKIIQAQLRMSEAELATPMVSELIQAFLDGNAAGNISTDQLLNALFLTVTLNDGSRRTFDDDELARLRATLMRQIGGAGG